MKIITLILVLLFNALVFAGETVYSTRVNRSDLQVGDMIDITYIPTFTYGSYVEKHTAKMKVIYNRESHTDIAWSTQWRYNVTFKFINDPSNTVHTIGISSEVNKYVYSEYQLFELDPTFNGQLSVEILGITAQYLVGSTWQNISLPHADPNLPGDINIELSVHTERFYELDVQEQIKIFVEETTTEIILDWNFIEGAEEYDLEWVYIDAETEGYAGLIGSLTSPTYDPESPFLFNEPARVRVNYNTYRIDKIFQTGSVFFRVRPVGRHTGTEVNGNYSFIKPGLWSYYKVLPGVMHVPNALAYVEIDPSNTFEQFKTWQYNIAFSENGKFASGITFADGALREKQSAAYNNTDDVTLKSENKFDYEGRVTISLPPALIDGRNLAYQGGLNTVSGVPFDKQHFDVSTPLPLDQSSGASQYFSANNIFDQENGGSIADANGYIYGQVKYKNDGSGRVIQSGGVGQTLSISGDHGVKYFYGTPTYVEIKRLFGSNAGDDVSYYQKFMTQDPNGLLSVSYSNGNGQTIATCLAGLPPDNMIALDGSIESVTTPLNTNNAIINDYTLYSEHQFLNPYIGNVLQLNYDFTGIIYTYDDVSGLIPKCEDCEYEVLIRITDPTGIETVQTQIVSYASFPTTCLESVYDVAEISFDYTCTMIGEYRITKQLTVLTNTMLEDYTSGIGNSGSLAGNIDAALSLVDLSGCFTDCNSYCAYIIEQEYEAGLDDQAFQNFQVNDPVGFNSFFQAAMVDCSKENCESAEFLEGDAEDLASGTGALFQMQCAGYYNQMQAQIMPGGAEHDNDDFWVNLQTEIDNSVVSFFATYDGSGVGIPPALTAQNVRDASVLLDEWIPLLVQNHREYCHYELCDLQVPSFQFDIQMYEFITSTSGLNNVWSEVSLSKLWTATNPDPFVDPLSTFDPNGTLLFYALTHLVHPDDPMITNLNLFEYIEELFIVMQANDLTNSLPTDPAEIQQMKWNLMKSTYAYQKQLIIDDHKANLPVPCDYFTDGNQIFSSGSEINVETDIPGATDYENFMYDNVDLLVPDCEVVCANNVDSWMYSLPVDCYDALVLANQLTALEAAFTAYCENYCNSSNPGAWFYNHDVAGTYPGGTDFYYNGVMDILTAACPSFSPTFELATPPLPEVVTLTGVVDQNFPLCYLRMINFLNNEFLPNNGEAVVSPSIYVIPDTDPLYNCGIIPAAPLTKGWRLDDSDPYYISEYNSDGIKLCERFIKVIGKEAPYVLLPVPWTDITHIGNLFKHNNGIDEYITGEITLVSGAVIVGIVEYASCYSPGSFDDMQVPGSVPDELIFEFPDWEQDCIDHINNVAIQNAINQYNDQIENAQSDFLNEAINCFEGINEIFTMTYDLYEYNYTLFYYDLAGNLVQTVPPAGVFPIPSSAFGSGGFLTNPNTLPAHTQETVYTYNGANLPIESESPDAGITTYHYDELLRLRFTQNAEQLNNDKFSYTKYDVLGRVKESGEAGDGDISNGVVNFATSVNDQVFPVGIVRDRTIFYYEEIHPSYPSIQDVFLDGQKNLRNQVGAVEQYTAQWEQITTGGFNVQPILGTEVRAITSYSYDAHGAVTESVQSNSNLGFLGSQMHKHFRYEHDLISGATEEVIYQEDKMDEWRHRYHYDASNRLIRVWTSDDGEEWEMDAKYFYYLHGSLARVEKGHDKVQGTDYTYTTQGWLKGANGTYLSAANDIGLDAHTTGLDKYSGADAFGYSLGYFSGDYQNISGDDNFANTTYLQTMNSAYASLYNGNITHMVTAMKDENENKINFTGNNYRYDLLQRLKSMSVFQVDPSTSYSSYMVAGFSATSSFNDDKYAEAYSYDKNGNIQTLTRRDQNGDLMDDFDYNYDDALRINRLTSVSDNPTTTASTVVMEDVKPGQGSSNYSYDDIGQLTSDIDEEIQEIVWTHDGKIRRIIFIPASTKPNLEFVYDHNGNRIMKVESGINHLDAVYTYYVYDGSGNLISTYERIIELPTGVGHEYILDEIRLTERVIYGTGRIGVKNEYNRILAHREFVTAPGTGYPFYAISDAGPLYEFPENFEKEKRKVGEKHYELSNHLNNILEVVTDRKVGNTGLTAYEADIISYSDYYPFGMVMPGRNGSTDLYRYGFQGQEVDDEIKGENNSVNYKYRMHDPRIGRFFAVDPLAPKYPHNSVYAFSENRVINSVELEGLESQISILGEGKYHSGTFNYLGPNNYMSNEGERTPNPNYSLSIFQNVCAWYNLPTNGIGYIVPAEGGFTDNLWGFTNLDYYYKGDNGQTKKFSIDYAAYSDLLHAQYLHDEAEDEFTEQLALEIWSLGWMAVGAVVPKGTNVLNNRMRSYISAGFQSATLNFGIQMIQTQGQISNVDYMGPITSFGLGFFGKYQLLGSVTMASVDAWADWTPSGGLITPLSGKPWSNFAVDLGFGSAANYSINPLGMEYRFGYPSKQLFHQGTWPHLMLEGTSNYLFLNTGYSINSGPNKK